MNDKNIRKLKIPADGSFCGKTGETGKPTLNLLLMWRSIPYKTIRSEYLQTAEEAWYEVEAQDISDTPLGRDMIEGDRRRKQIASDYISVKEELFSRFMRHENLYVGRNISMPEGWILADSFNSYGYGHKVIIASDRLWLVCNSRISEKTSNPSNIDRMYHGYMLDKSDDNLALIERYKEAKAAFKAYYGYVQE